MISPRETSPSVPVGILRRGVLGRRHGKEKGGPLPSGGGWATRQGLLSESQGQDLVLTVLYTPHSLDDGRPEALGHYKHGKHSMGTEGPDSIVRKVGMMGG